MFQKTSASHKGTSGQKSPTHNNIQMNEHKNHDGCLSGSIKNQTRTSKISVVFIVLAGQLRNSRHWQRYKQKEDLEKGHLIGLDLIPLDIIPTLRESPFSIIISGTIEPRHSLDRNSTGTIHLTKTQCSCQNPMLMGHN